MSHRSVLPAPSDVDPLIHYFFHSAPGSLTARDPVVQLVERRERIRDTRQHRVRRVTGDGMLHAGGGRMRPGTAWALLLAAFLGI